MKQQLSIEGMSCMHCVKHVTNALKEVNDVTSVVVSLEEKIATIEVKNPVSEATLKAAIEEAGYELKSIK
jgi:copper chaperone CopZ